MRQECVVTLAAECYLLSRRSAGALPEALPSRACVAGGTDPLPEAGVEDQEKEEQFRAGLKTGSEVGTFLLGVKVSPGPDGKTLPPIRCFPVAVDSVFWQQWISPVVFQLGGTRWKSVFPLISAERVGN